MLVEQGPSLSLGRSTGSRVSVIRHLSPKLKVHKLEVTGVRMAGRYDGGS